MDYSDLKYDMEEFESDQDKKLPQPNVIKLRNDGFEGNTKNVLLFFLWKI